MPVFYPDIASYQAGISLAGADVVAVKATEDGGAGPASRYANPDYTRVLAEARQRGIVAIAYHYLHGTYPVAEAAYAMSVIGAGVPIMLDVEAYGADVDDVLRFTAEARRLGGHPCLVYLPRWYWLNIGGPDLRPLVAAGLSLVSSHYTLAGYTPDGPGWAPYGGMTPVAWQYTDRGQFNGRPVDMNVFRGTLVEFTALLTGGQMSTLDYGTFGPPAHDAYATDGKRAETAPGVMLADVAGQEMVGHSLYDGTGQSYRTRQLNRMETSLAKLTPGIVDPQALVAAIVADPVALGAIGRAFADALWHQLGQLTSHLPAPPA